MQEERKISRRKRRTRVTGKESSLFDFVEEVEKLYCGYCKALSDVKEQSGQWVLLGCGHRTIRELSVSEQRTVALHMDIGFPNADGGWYKPTDKDYPGPNEMKYKVGMYPELIEKIRSYLGEPKWNP